jgi:multidrug efflux system membrane fusion protein
MRYLAQRQFVVVSAAGVLATLGMILTQSDSRAQTKAGAPAPRAAIAPSPPPTANPYADFFGHTEAVQTVEVRPSMPGLLTKIVFREGQEVRQGDLLFEFDPRPHKFALDLARAELARALAERAGAETDSVLQRQLHKNAGATQAEVDRATTRVAVAKAMVEAAQAKVASAQWSVESTRITSPINGRIGRALLSPGWVPAGVTLAVIVSQDPIHVYFAVGPGQCFQLLRQWHASGGSAPAKPPRIPVKICLSSEEGFAREGVIDFIDNRFNPKRGTIRVRALVPNADRLMLPGLMVQVRMPLEPSRKP